MRKSSGTGKKKKAVKPEPEPEVLPGKPPEKLTNVGVDEAMLLELKAIRDKLDRILQALERLERGETWVRVKVM